MNEAQPLPPGAAGGNAVPDGHSHQVKRIGCYATTRNECVRYLNNLS